MSCEKFRKSISVYLDGRLDAAGERALEEHLSRCPRCAEALASLQTAEKAARGAPASEPGPGYWDTFSGRVMDRIEARQQEPSGFSLKRLSGVFFSTPPRRLRLAAGIASIALAFAVGIVFVEHRGEKIFPREAATPEDKPLAVAEGPDAAAETPPATGKEPVADENEAPAKGEAARQAPEREAAATEATRKKDSEEKAPQEETRAQALAEAESDVAERVEPPAEAAEKATELTLETVKDSETRTLRTPAATFTRANEKTLPSVAEGDTSLAAGELRDFIAMWRARIDARPDDPASVEGYRQVATAYALLARQAPGDSLVAEGAAVIRDYLERTTDPDLKRFLASKLQEIEGPVKK